MNRQKIKIFDSTLRDGAQAEGISFTIEDKIRVLEALDILGVDYVEAGNPGSNQKDMEFFQRTRDMELKNVSLTAFGSTRRVNIFVEDDQNVKALLLAQTPSVTIFGKAWDFHVTDVLKTTREENLKMIEDTIKFFIENNKDVVFDAEHFFDGHKADKEYALEVCRVAANAGASAIVLCDTNGGTMPYTILNATKDCVEICKSCNSVDVGIHCHNDTGMAVANSMMAVEAGARHVQGTMNGFGERCGNADLSSIIPNLQLKLNYLCIPEENMLSITEISRKISEIANIKHNERAPYVGKSSFAHKAGMHIDGVNKNASSFEHLNPELVGNERRFLMSEQAGRSLILKKVNKIEPRLTKESPETVDIINTVKRLEHQGYKFESAEASFELHVRKVLGYYNPFFQLKHFKVTVDEPKPDGSFSSTAMIKVEVGDKEEIAAAEGDGPVNALDKALRKVLLGFYPQLHEMYLTDYKVRVIENTDTTAAKVRVLIQSTNGSQTWSTVGVSTDIIEASWIALVDSIEYSLIKSNTKNL
ncbi:MAG: citramalate synthase [Spirochaetales bacterium]|nr:citramalate synthase [Spirochaetales bacterium]